MDKYVDPKGGVKVPLVLISSVVLLCQSERMEQRTDLTATVGEKIQNKRVVSE